MALTALLPSALTAATPATIFGADLVPRRVQLQSIDNGVVTYFDAKRVYRSEPLDKLVQIRELGEARAALPDLGPAIIATTAPGTATQPTTAPAVGMGKVELIDGQSFGGQFIAGAADGQSFVWSNPLLGRVTIRLERLRSMTFAGAALDEVEGGDDVLNLVQGDRVEGFVVGIKESSVELRPTGRGPAVVVGMGLVRALRLANSAAAQPMAGNDPVRADGALATLSDGSRLGLRQFSLVGDEVQASFALATQRTMVKLPAAAVRRIDLNLSAGRLVPLGDLPRSVEGGLVFGEPFPPRVARDELRLHAPVTLRIPLPPGARMFTATALIDTDNLTGATRDHAPSEVSPREPVARVSPWVDMEMIVRVDDRIIDQRRFNAQAPTATLTLPLDGKALVIELREGANGPVLDRLKLAGAAVLVTAASETRPADR